MLEEIHELTGVCALAIVIATITAGAAAYRYQLLRRFLSLQRQLLVRIHRWGVVGFVMFVVLHYFTTDKRQALLYAGVFAFAIVVLLGLSLRWSRRFFHPVIAAKLCLVLFAAVVLPIGHEAVEGKEGRRQGDGGRASRFERVIPSEIPPVLAGIGGRFSRAQ